MEDTYCPKCKEAVVKRKGFMIIENKLKDGKCKCGQEIAGVWK
jgi:pyruvate formate lyase activating enzyme